MRPARAAAPIAGRNTIAGNRNDRSNIGAEFPKVSIPEAVGNEKETNNDAVMERVDDQVRIIGFSILRVSRFAKGKPLEADLASA